MNTTERWIAHFSAELERRDVSDDRIRDEVDTVRHHLRDGGDDPFQAFGDPLAYAATLADPVEDPTPSSGTVIALFGAIAAFIVLVVGSVRWIDGDEGSAAWAIAGGVAFITALAALSIALTRRAIAAALRDRLDRTTDSQWSLSATLLLLAPWTFVGFAGLVLALAAIL